jgi:hypothetical protein
VNEHLDLHMTALFTWLVRTVGKALMFSMLLPLVVYVIAMMMGQFELVWFGVVAAPFVFAWRLMGAEAPFPVEPRDETHLSHRRLTSDG